MTRRTLLLLALAVARLGSPARAADAPVDRHGDPLPPGAVQRFGTVRFWAESPFEAAAFSPDGAVIASGHGDHSVRLWDAATGKPRGRLAGHGSAVQAVAFSPDGKVLATRSGGSLFRDNHIRLWDVAVGKEVRAFAGFKLARDRGDGSNHQALFDLVFTPDGRSLLTGPGDPEDTSFTLTLWDVATGKSLRPFAGHHSKVNSFAVSPDGKAVASASDDRTVRLWDLASGAERYRLAGHQDRVLAVAFSPDGRLVASAGGDEDRSIRLWDAATGRPVRRLGRIFAERALGYALAFAPDGKTLIATTGPGALTFWDVATGRLRAEFLDVNRAGGRAVRVSADGRRVLVLGFAGPGRSHVLPVWDVPNKRPLLPDVKHQQNEPTALAVSPDGRRLATAGEDRRAWVWDVAAARVERELPAEPWSVDLLAFASADELYTGGFMGLSPRLWDVRTGRVLRSLDLAPIAAAFSADGTRFASAQPREVRLFDRKTGRLVAARSVPNNGVRQRSLAFTADSRHLLWADERGLGVMDARTGKVAGGVEQEGTFEHFALSPDGRTVATSAFGFALWDWPRGARLRNLPVRTKDFPLPQSLQFSADGRWLAAAGSDHVLRVWEVATGGQLREYRPYTPPPQWAQFNALAFPPDSRTVITAGRDGQILQWDLTGRLRDGRLRPAPLPPADLQRRWDALAGDDAEAAFDAVWALAAAPDNAVPFLRARLRPAAPVDEAAVVDLVQALGAEAFERREAATKALAQLGEPAAPALRRELAKGPPLEVRRRLASLLDALTHAPLGPDPRREQRALAALEQMGPAPGRPLVEVLAGGAEGRLAREARQVLARWAAGGSSK